MLVRLVLYSCGLIARTPNSDISCLLVWTVVVCLVLNCSSTGNHISVRCNMSSTGKKASPTTQAPKKPSKPVIFDPTPEEAADYGRGKCPHKTLKRAADASSSESDSSAVRATKKRKSKKGRKGSKKRPLTVSSSSDSESSDAKSNGESVGVLSCFPSPITTFSQYSCSVRFIVS